VNNRNGIENEKSQVTPAPNTPLFGAGPKALTGLKGVFHWPKANLEWKTPRDWSRCDQSQRKKAEGKQKHTKHSQFADLCYNTKETRKPKYKKSMNKQRTSGRRDGYARLSGLADICGRQAIVLSRVCFLETKEAD
jgi:hypothetical protein